MNLPASYADHFRKLIALGVPIIIGQIGMIVLGFADTIMIGHYSTESLGAASFVNNLFNLVIIGSTGFAYGLTPVIGELFGASDRTGIGGKLKNALFVNFTVAIVFGVGTVGGALTPSLTIGSVCGFLFSAALTQLGVPGDHAIAYSLVGMAAFFTTAANAPITSLVLVVEFTMAGQMMFPLIIGVLVSYGMARLTKAQSMYHDSLAFGPRSTFDKPLAQVQLQDVARKDPPVVHPLDKFGTIAAMLIKNPAQPIFVTSPTGKYLGSVVAEDVAAFARNKELAQAVLAMDVLRSDMPTLPADMHLPEALGIFSRPHCAESLALVNPNNDLLLGVVNKTDLYLVLSEIMRREKLQ